MGTNIQVGLFKKVSKDALAFDLTLIKKLQIIMASGTSGPDAKPIEPTDENIAKLELSED